MNIVARNFFHHKSHFVNHLQLQLQDLLPVYRASCLVDGQRPYLTYKEDISRTNQEGLSSRKKQPKEVRQYVNLQNPSRCFVRLYNLHNSKCPVDRSGNPFYLTPLSKPKGDVWFSKVPLGYNHLSQVVNEERWF